MNNAQETSCAIMYSAKPVTDTIVCVDLRYC